MLKGADKFLIVIVVGLLALVVVAVGLAVTRSAQVAYQPDDAPDGVTFNYLLALQQADYERAYGYISPRISNYPDSAGAFAAQIEQSPDLRYNRNSALAVDSTRAEGDTAWVKVRETRYTRGFLLSNNQYSHTFQVTLRRDGGAWKIVDSEGYWYWDWRKKS